MTVKSSTNSPSGQGREEGGVKYFLHILQTEVKYTPANKMGIWLYLIPTQSFDKITPQVLLQAVTILIIIVSEKKIGGLRNFPNRLCI